MKKLKKVEWYIDSKRRLYVKDGKEYYEFSVDGLGSPAYYYLQTEKERIEVDKEVRRMKRKWTDMEQKDMQRRKEKEANKPINRIKKIMFGS